MRPLSAIACFTFLAAFAGDAHCRDMTPLQKEKYMARDFPHVALRMENAVVKVKVKLLGEVDIAVGNGFYVSHDGIVATARHLLTNVAEQGMTIEVTDRNGVKLRDPKLLGCAAGKLELCFLDTGKPPGFWFRMDQDVNYFDGHEGFVLGSTLVDVNKLQPLAIAKVERGKFPKPHRMTLSKEVEPELAGSPIFDMYGALLGIVTSKTQVGDETVPGIAVGAQTIARFLALMRGQPRDTVASLKEKRARGIRRDALALQRLTQSQAKRLAAGKDADKKHFRYVDFAANGAQFSLPIPKQINPKTCRREQLADGAALVCGTGRAQLRISVQKHQDHLRYLDQEPAGIPRVIDLVAKEMRLTPSYWDSRMRDLPPKVRDRLASDPGTWSCRDEAATEAPLLPRGFRCRAQENDFGQVGDSVVRLLVQTPALDSSVEFAAIGDSSFGKGLWSLVAFLARGTKLRPVKSERGLASVMTPAGRLRPVRDFCYVDQRYCWLKAGRR